MDIAIIANGDIHCYPSAKKTLANAQYIIACDGGLRHLQAMQLFPNHIVGDLDSAPKAYLEDCKAKGIPINQYPTAKDDTDLALAMDYALTLRPTSIKILGALGGRFDHALGNLHVLAMAKGTPAEIWSETTSVTLIEQNARSALLFPKSHRETPEQFPGTQKKALIPQGSYRTISLIPLTTVVKGITTTGLLYPLTNEALHMGFPRGISNEFTAPVAEITVGDGVLVVVCSV